MGDLSLEDADVLAHWARRSAAILEFGAGGSTQIMSQCGTKHILSIETKPSWIELTQQRLQLIPDHGPVEFRAFTTTFDREYDMVFVDGEWYLRETFALAAWLHLRVGGVMLFHDTRRDFDFVNAMTVAQKKFLEVSQIDVNAKATNGRSSNITVIHKKTLEPYVNWNQTEGKPAWAYGVPDGQHHDLWSQHA